MKTTVAWLMVLALSPIVATAGDNPKKTSTATKGPTIEELTREVEDAISLSETYGAEGFSPQEIQEVKQLLDLPFPPGDEGAALKARVYVELSRIYALQEISPMAIKLLQDAIAELTGHVGAEIALREELVDLYRSLGFAPQAIREHKRIRALRARARG